MAQRFDVHRSTKSWMLNSNLVNTRCIYYRIKSAQADPDNLTMCPILDFANHTTSSPTVVPQASSADIWDMAPPRHSSEGITLLSPREKTVEEGEELHLRYGFHSNQFLFTEYGFATESERGCIDITPAIEELLNERGKVGQWLKERLQEEGYWGCAFPNFAFVTCTNNPVGREWTLHAAPAPAHPSFRSIAALRLYTALPDNLEGAESFSGAEDVLDVWRATVLGNREWISRENEVRWKKILLEVCKQIVTVSANRRESVLAQLESRKAEGDSSAEPIVSSIVCLWDEEAYVAESVIESLHQGVPF